MKDFSNSQDCWHIILASSPTSDQIKNVEMKWHSVGVGGTRCPCGHQSEVQIRSSLPECHIKAARKSALATVVSVASLVTEPYQHSTSPQQSSPNIFSVPGLPLSLPPSLPPCWTSVVHLDVEDFSEELLQCLLCHKEPARRIQSPLLGALERKKPPTRGFLLAPRWFFMA